MSVLDTSITIRYLTQDSPELSPRARTVVEQLRTGTLSTRLPEGALVETVQVLESKVLYNTPRAVIQRGIAGLLTLPGEQTGTHSCPEAVRDYVASELCRLPLRGLRRAQGRARDHQPRPWLQQ